MNKLGYTNSKLTLFFKNSGQNQSGNSTNMELKTDNNKLKSRGILFLKSRFFAYRIICYFSFLLIPVWIQKTQDLNQSLQCLMMVLYIGFMIGQWFLLGKEIDYRLKIYFRVNSSIDRVVYRMFLGMIFIVLYFNMLSFLPSKWIYNLFWTTWVVLGLFYSWPTRGKIIKESVSTNFAEFRYLDSFEKTLLGLIALLFLFSVPKLPTLVNIEALKLYFDSAEKFMSQGLGFYVRSGNDIVCLASAAFPIVDNLLVATFMNQWIKRCMAILLRMMQ